MIWSLTFQETKNSKNTKSFYLSILTTNYLHKRLIHLNFDTFSAAMFIYFCKIPNNIQDQKNILSHWIG